MENEVKNVVEQASSIISYHEELMAQYDSISDKLHAESEKIFPELIKLIDTMSKDEILDFYDSIEHTSSLKFDLFKHVKDKGIFEFK